MNEQFVAYKEITQGEFERLKSFINLVEPAKGLFLDREAIPMTASAMMPVVMQKEGKLLMRVDYLPTLIFGAAQAGLAEKESEASARLTEQQAPDFASVKAQMQALIEAVMETYRTDFVANNPSPVAKIGFHHYESQVFKDLNVILEQF